MKSNTKLWLAGLLLVAGIGALILMKKENAIEGVTVHPEIGSLRSAFYTTGVLAYRQQARLSPEVIAKVTELHVQEGEAVVKGQILLKLDDSNLQSEIAQFQAQLAQSEIEIQRAKVESNQKIQEWRRQQDLFQKGMVSNQAIELAQVALENAKLRVDASEKIHLQNNALLEQKKQQLSRTIIRSPMDGTVVTLPIKVGETAIASATGLAGSSLMTVADPSSMLVEAQVSEWDIGRIKLGQSAQVKVRSHPHQLFPGKVIRIARSINSDGKNPNDTKVIKTITVQIELDSQNAQFIAGQSCDVSLIEAAQEKALLIPLTALKFEDVFEPQLITEKKRKYFVWRVEHGRATKTVVTLGYADEHKQEIKTGLDGREEILIGPSYMFESIKEGDVIRRALASPRT